jgi:hypothetical protein
MLIINEQHFYPAYDALLRTKNILTTTSWLQGDNLNIDINYLYIMRPWAGNAGSYCNGKSVEGCNNRKIHNS